MEKFAAMVHFATTESLDVFNQRMEVSIVRMRSCGTLLNLEMLSLVDPGFFTRIGVHYGLFLGALRSGATTNQMCKSNTLLLRFT